MSHVSGGIARATDGRCPSELFHLALTIDRHPFCKMLWQLRLSIVGFSSCLCGIIDLSSASSSTISPRLLYRQQFIKPLFLRVPIRNVKCGNFNTTMLDWREIHIWPLRILSSVVCTNMELCVLEELAHKKGCKMQFGLYLFFFFYLGDKIVSLTSQINHVALNIFHSRNKCYSSWFYF